MLVVDLRTSRGDFVLDASFEAVAGRIVVLVGENGSGKTTLLRTLAGLERPARGVVRCGAATWYDSASGVWCEPEARSVGYVPQSHALFPHLDVAGNIGYGLKACTRDQRAHRIERMAVRLGLETLLHRPIASLSGGERQRVALARALVREPGLLLLDEPLAALDPLTRGVVRSELRRTLSGLDPVMLLVTHDPADALALADDLVVLDAGRIVRSGAITEVLTSPASAWGARLPGVNLWFGTVAGPAEDGLSCVRIGEATIVVPATLHQAVRVVVHPREITLALAEPEGSARNHLRGRVRELRPDPPHGDVVRVTLDGRPGVVAQVTRASVTALGLRPGVDVIATFKATACEVLPA